MAAILTRSGRMVDLLDVKPEDIDLDDIAHSLAQTCRFAGHTKRHYSVAEHSINVARLLPEPIKIYGVLHDAHEAYIGDISTPLKRTLEDAGYMWGDVSFRDVLRFLEDKTDTAIYSALGVPPPGTLIRDAVKCADETVAVMEMRELFDTQPPAGQWGIDETLGMGPPPPVPNHSLYSNPCWTAEDWAASFKHVVRKWTAR